MPVKPKNILPVDKKRLQKILKSKNLGLDKLSEDLGYSKSWVNDTLSRNGGFPKSIIDLFSYKYGIKYDDIKPETITTATPSADVTDIQSSITAIQLKLNWLNNNILDRLNTIVCLTDKINALEKEIAGIKVLIEDKSNALAWQIVQYRGKPEAKAIPKEDEKPKTEIKNLPSFDYMTADTDNMSLLVYEEKVFELARMIAPMQKETVNNCMNRYYTRMTEEYGVVYSDLRQLFKEEYNRRWKNSVEVLFIDKTFRRIFWNIMITDWYNMKQKAC